MTSIILAVLLASAGDSASIVVGTPRTSVDSFELPMQASARVLHRIERHVVGRRLVLFVPGVAAAAQVTNLEVGPISQVRVSPVHRGVALTFAVRNGSEASLEKLSLELEPEPLLRYLGTPHAESNQSAVKSTDLGGADVMPARRTSPIEAALIPEQRNASKTGLAATSSTASGTRTPLLAITFLLLIAAVVAVRVRQRRQARLATIGESIDVVAVHSFGAKQKLVLVNTCGDRLLLATTDKEVRLLKNLGPHAATVAFDETLAAANDVAAVGPADIAGLLRLRERRGQDIAAVGDESGIVA